MCLSFPDPFQKDMKKILTCSIFVCWLAVGHTQQVIPIDTNNWEIQAAGYILETFEGKDAIYLKGGSMTLKEAEFLNGTIEFDIFHRGERGFPGIYFRSVGNNAEQFYIRPHQSGNPDANQATGQFEGITPWQLMFGPKYSFPYVYQTDDWTHVKLVVNGDQAQVYLDNSSQPHLSWKLFHETRPGGITINGGNLTGMYIADVKIDPDRTALVDFNPITREPLDNLVPSWELSDMFEEKELNDPDKLDQLIANRQWDQTVQVEEGTAANISRKVFLFDGTNNNTVFARTTIRSDRDQTKLFEFGYSDRTVAVLNGQPIYKGTNRFRSRDYRYLGTIGLFDAIYLDLKKGDNTLMFAVSEDFGGWLITGRFANQEGIKIK